MNKFLISSVLAVAMASMPMHRAHADSDGFSALVSASATSLVGGSGSLAYGKIKNVKNARVAGWVFLASGGVVSAGTTSVAVVAAAFTAALIGSLFGQVMMAPFVSISPHDRGYRLNEQGQLVPVTSLLNEVEGDAVLASTLRSDEGVDSLMISSVARALKVSPAALGQSVVRAKDLADAKQGSRFGDSLKSVSDSEIQTLVMVQGASREPVVGLLKNYLRLRNVVPQG